MLPTVAVKDTAKDAWEAVKTVRVGVQRVREENAQKHRREFGEITFKDGESIDDFSKRITGLANNLRVLGDNISDAEIVRKFLQVVPARLSQVAISIETLLDLNELSVEEVTGRLRTARDCHSKKKGHEKSHITQAEEDEPALLMAPQAEEQRVPERAPMPFEPLKLEEAKVFTQLGQAGERGHTKWVLDIGATNNMTDSRSAFSKLDTGVHGTVSFRDGSVVNIEGHDIILFMCKNGEHRALTDVYFIPHLTANIVSIGQLDEFGCDVHIGDGFLHISDE
ncbi:uncharacterized protein LOC133910654 [Phragmites australis]|uniref:uncharacterized protein LOC133910654 n=1 Tax=Phragmites australis TaxID=29695 RepID=UPI002D77EABD|nr:uncharacterized protein LOC133910654 [Phragmites australis]